MNQRKMNTSGVQLDKSAAIAMLNQQLAQNMGFCAATRVALLCVNMKSTCKKWVGKFIKGRASK